MSQQIQSKITIRRKGSIYESVLRLESGELYRAGRDPDSHIHLDDPVVKPLHAEIFTNSEGDFSIKSVGRTKIEINCRQVEEEVLLNGDQISLGPFVLTFTTSSLQERIIQEILDIIPGADQEVPAVRLKLKKLMCPEAERVISLKAKVIKALCPGAVTGEAKELSDEFDDLAGAVDDLTEEKTSLQKERELTLAFGRISRVINCITDLRELLSSVLDSSIRLFGADHAFIMLARKGSSKMVPVAGKNRLEQEVSAEAFNISTSIGMEAARVRRPILTLNAMRDPRFMNNQSIVMVGTRQIMAAPMIHGNSIAGVLYVDKSQNGGQPFRESFLDIMEMFANHTAVAIENSRLYGRIQKHFLATVEALATALEYKDPYTEGHSKRVQKYSVFIAREMGLDSPEIENLKYAALLHDIGKIGIEDSILQKTMKLSEEEYSKIREHTSMGARLIGPVQLLIDKIPAVRHHHERWDGKGYPDGLTGEAIPLQARIIAVADAYDAMTSRRSYRDAMTSGKAISEILGNSGTQFDPAVVEIFKKIARRCPSMQDETET